MKKTLPIGLFTYLLMGFLPPLAHAQAMSNDTYTIQKHATSIEQYTQEQPTPPQEKSQPPYASGNHFVAQTNKPEPFAFTIGQSLLDYGKVTATNPVIRDITLTISSKGAYQILAAQDHPLTKDTTTIPDTTCDNGSCSQITNADWTSNLTYGFGYHTNSMGSDSYQQFADNARNEGFQPILEGVVAFNQEHTLTTKVNISAAQESGTYSNKLILIATPDF